MGQKVENKVKGNLNWDISIMLVSHMVSPSSE